MQHIKAYITLCTQYDCFAPIRYALLCVLIFLKILKLKKNKTWSIIALITHILTMKNWSIYFFFKRMSYTFYLTEILDQNAKNYSNDNLKIMKSCQFVFCQLQLLAGQIKAFVILCENRCVSALPCRVACPTFPY